MDQEKIGRFIAELRKENSLTQKELAEKLNVSDRTVGNWERAEIYLILHCSFHYVRY